MTGHRISITSSKVSSESELLVVEADDEEAEEEEGDEAEVGDDSEEV